MNIILYFAIIIGFIIIYHHLLYPLLLRLLASLLPQNPHDNTAQNDASSDAGLPHIHLILPAYNEADVVARKIRNLSELDYPRDKLKITLIGDGCSDDTIAIATSVMEESGCRHLPLEICGFSQNRGKIAVLNQAINASSSEIIALSDISALINADGLRIAARRFRDPAVAVVNSSYHFSKYSSSGEAAYWDYQSKVKQMESRTGSVIGAHGALYFFRQALFTTLRPDTINDDFVLPMQIVAQGYRAVHEPDIVALELECVKPDANNNRRKRIAAGNLQQAYRLRRLLLPTFGGVAFNFLSGKVLRVFMPLCLMMFYAASLILAFEFIAFTLLAAGQTLFYAIALQQHFRSKKNVGQQQRLGAVIYYFSAGHWYSFVGMVEYLMKKRTFKV